MAVNETEFKNIIKWVQEELDAKSECYQGAVYGDFAVPMSYINALGDADMYDKWKATQKKGKVAVQVSAEVVDAFNVWWKEFPATSKFTYKDMFFSGERVLKANKQVCLKLYAETSKELQKGWSLPQTGDSMLLKALQVQLANIRIESYKTKQNRMQYLKNAETYLRQRAYEAWIGEEMPVGQQEKQVTDYTYNG